jgi:hypothetical protein
MDEELQTLQIKLALKFADEGKVLLGQRRTFHGCIPHNSILSRVEQDGNSIRRGAVCVVKDRLSNASKNAV